MPIRKDTTKSTKASRADWEVKALRNDEDANREAEKQEGLMKSWENIMNSGDRARMEEYELARRISGVTEGDTSENRTQEAIKDFKRSEIVEEALQRRQDRGQSVEEFAEELEGFGKDYRKAVKKAYEAVK